MKKLIIIPLLILFSFLVFAVEKPDGICFDFINGDFCFNDNTILQPIVIDGNLSVQGDISSAIGADKGLIIGGGNTRITLDGDDGFITDEFEVGNFLRVGGDASIATNLNVTGNTTLLSFLNMTGNNIVGIDNAIATMYYVDSVPVCLENGTYCTSINVNSSDYWDDLDTPLNITNLYRVRVDRNLSVGIEGLGGGGFTVFSNNSNEKIEWNPIESAMTRLFISGGVIISDEAINTSNTRKNVEIKSQLRLSEDPIGTGHYNATLSIETGALSSGSQLIGVNVDHEDIFNVYENGTLDVGTDIFAGNNISANKSVRGDTLNAISQVRIENTKNQILTGGASSKVTLNMPGALAPITISTPGLTTTLAGLSAYQLFTNINGFTATPTSMYVAERIVHSGDENTYFTFSSHDDAKLYVGGEEMHHWHEEAIEGWQDTSICNPSGKDIDCSTYDDSSNILFHSDANLKSVGIGTNTPRTRLDVEGDVTADNLCYTNGTNCPGAGTFDFFNHSILVAINNTDTTFTADTGPIYNLTLCLTADEGSCLDNVGGVLYKAWGYSHGQAGGGWDITAIDCYGNELDFTRTSVHHPLGIPTEDFGNHWQVTAYDLTPCTGDYAIELDEHGGAVSLTVQGSEIYKFLNETPRNVSVDPDNGFLSITLDDVSDSSNSMRNPFMSSSCTPVCRYTDNVDSRGLGHSGNTGVLTVNQDGVYSITLDGILQISSSDEVLINITNNGASIWAYDVYVHSAVDPVTRGITIIKSLSDGDEIEAYIGSVDGVDSVTFHDGTTISIHQVGKQ